MAGNQGNYREKPTRNEKNYKKANGQPRLKEKSSRAKSDNVCPYAKKCGGCDYQGVEYKEQLKTKQAYMKKLLKPFCFMFAAKCLKAGGFTGAIADFPTAIHRAVKGQMQTTTDYLNGEQTEYDESVFTGEYHYYYEKLSDDDKLIYRQIYAMMQKRMDGISLNTTDTDNVSRIQQFVLLDNPQFFYIEKSQYIVRNSIIFSPV